MRFSPTPSVNRSTSIPMHSSSVCQHFQPSRSSSPLTTSLYLADPALLWQTFDTLRPSTAISMPTHYDQNSPEWHHASKICSCVMLLDLSKLRSLRLMDSSIYRADPTSRYPSALSPPLFRSLFGPPGPEDHYEGVALGDQGYFWAIVSQRPDIFEHLSFDWEVSSCLVDMYGTGLDRNNDGATDEEESPRMLHLFETPHQGGVVHPKLVHLSVPALLPPIFLSESGSSYADLIQTICCI